MAQQARDGTLLLQFALHRPALVETSTRDNSLLVTTDWNPMRIDHGHLCLGETERNPKNESWLGVDKQGARDVGIDIKGIH